MSSLEKRAWLSLISMFPAYLAYFTVVISLPSLLPGMLQQISWLAIIACIHAVIYLAGYMVFKRQERMDHLLSDERDHAIEGRATRIAYFLLMAGMILVGAVMPFEKSGWDIANTALLVVVLCESLRDLLIIRGYRTPRFAH